MCPSDEVENAGRRIFALLFAGRDDSALYGSRAVVEPGLGVESGAGAAFRFAFDYRFVAGRSELSGPRLSFALVVRIGAVRKDPR